MLPDIRIFVAAILTTIALVMIAFALVATIRVAQTGAKSPLQIARQQAYPPQRTDPPQPDPVVQTDHPAPEPARVTVDAAAPSPIAADPPPAPDDGTPVQPAPNTASEPSEADRRALDAIIAAMMHPPEPLLAPAVHLAPAAPEAIAAARPPLLASAAPPGLAIVLPSKAEAAPAIGGPAPAEAATDRARTLAAITKRKAQAEAARKARAEATRKAQVEAARKAQVEAAARKARLARARQARINAAKRAAQQQPAAPDTMLDLLAR